MIRSFLNVAVFIIFLLGCSGKNKIPKGILSQEKMGSVLWDMICADEFVSGYVLLKDPLANRKQESLKLYDQVYHIHEIKKEDFQKSLSFYQSHPNLLMDILDSLNVKHTTLSTRPRMILSDTLRLNNKNIQ